MKKITKNPYMLLAAIVFAFSVSTATYAFSGTLTSGLQSKFTGSATTSSTPSEPAVKDIKVSKEADTVANIDKRIIIDGIYIQPLALYEDAGALSLRVAYMNKETGMEMATVLIGAETSFAGKRITLLNATPNTSVKGGYDFTFSVKNPS